MFSLIGCNNNKKNDTSKAKLVPKEDLVQIPAPDAMQFFTGAKGQELKPGDKRYKDALEYFDDQFSTVKLKPTKITIETLAKDLAKEKSIAFAYSKATTIALNIENQKKKNESMSIMAIMLSGQYKGYVFFGQQNNKTYTIYEKIDISNDILDKIK